MTILLLQLFFCHIGYTQQETLPSTPLKIGDDASGIVLKHIKNFQADSLKLADFKGKLIILDFWDVSCVPCIAYMPVMEKLQQQYEGKIQIILVTTDSAEKVERSAKRIETIRNIKLPSMLGDRQLTHRFPFRSLPSHVWIDQCGIIRYIADGPYTTSKNISRFLNGEDIALPVKSQIKDLDFGKPLWLEGSGRFTPLLKYYSYMMGYINEGSSRYGVLKDKNSNRVNTVKLFNIPALIMYKIAFGESIGAENPFWNNNRIIIQTTDSSRYFPPSNESLLAAWMQDHSYCYEMSVPPSRSDHLFQLMRHELEMFFPLTGKIEMKHTTCLLLVYKDLKRIQTKGGRPSQYYSKDHNVSRLHLQNMPLEMLLGPILAANDRLSTPIVNRLNGEIRIDADIDADFYNIDKLKNNLKELGIELVKQELEIPFLVLHE